MLRNIKRFLFFFLFFCDWYNGKNLKKICLARLFYPGFQSKLSVVKTKWHNNT